MKKILVPVALGIALTTSLKGITPEEILSETQSSTVINGVELRKGSIGSLVVNAQAIDVLLSEDESQKEVFKAIADIRANIIAVNGSGFFELLPLNGWLSDASRSGNIIVALVALQEIPGLMTDALRARLQDLSELVTGLVKTELSKLV